MCGSRTAKGHVVVEERPPLVDSIVVLPCISCVEYDTPPAILIAIDSFLSSIH